MFFSIFVWLWMVETVQTWRCLITDLSITSPSSKQLAYVLKFLLEYKFPGIMESLCSIGLLLVRLHYCSTKFFKTLQAFHSGLTECPDLGSTGQCWTVKMGGLVLEVPVQFCELSLKIKVVWFESEMKFGNNRSQEKMYWNTGGLSLLKKSLISGTAAP